VKIDTFIHISKGGFFISSTKNAFFEDETVKLTISSSKQCIFEDEQGPMKTKNQPRKAGLLCRPNTSNLEPFGGPKEG